MSDETPPPRLHVVFARRKPRAVVFRRGPSRWYHLILWNTARDTFESGAWFRGRIYVERCDLSPDGELLLYFALQGRKWNTSYQGAWTAVSRAPWLHALTLWPEGSTWGGGGHFHDDRRIVLAGSPPTHPDHPLCGLEVVDEPCTRVVPTPDIAEAEWSGYDQGGYPVYARSGKLFRRLPLEDRELADFNGLTPNPTEAPAWARAPLPDATSGSRGEPRRRGGRRRRERRP